MGTDIEADHQEGGPLPEVVRLTADREEWRRVITGLNSSQGP